MPSIPRLRAKRWKARLLRSILPLAIIVSCLLVAVVIKYGDRLREIHWFVRTFLSLNLVIAFFIGLPKLLHFARTLPTDDEIIAQHTAETPLPSETSKRR